MAVDTGPSALKFLAPVSGYAYTMFTSGTVPGIAVYRAADRNGEGFGDLRLRNKHLSWREPGATAFGPEVYVPGAGGFFHLLGSDPDKYLLILAYLQFLPDGEQSARVRLRARQGRAGISDAPPPFIDFWNVDLRNASTQTQLRQLRAWVDPASLPHIFIRWGAGDPWVQPSTEATALFRSADVPPSTTFSLLGKTDVAALTPYRPQVPAVVHFAWDGN